jgi:hypothetical protein
MADLSPGWLERAVRGRARESATACATGQVEEHAETGDEPKGGEKAMTMSSALVMMLAELVAVGGLFYVGWRIWPRGR